MDFMNRLSVVGLGKLGSPMVACLADRDFEVMGVDYDRVKVNQLSDGVAPVEEPGLSELILANRNRISSTTECKEATIWSEATFLVVPTPSNPDGSFSLRYLLAACESVGDGLKEKADWHLVVVTSTVSPTSMDRYIRPTLEERSGKRCGVEFGLCYSPEFIALGDVLKGLQRPDFLLIGESDQRAGDKLSEIYARLCHNKPPNARMNFINAELSKLSVNAFVTTKMTFANMLARLCERLPGADVDVVTGALGLDSRIGSKYLQGALAYGGPCFPRDNIALTSLAKSVGCSAPLAEITDTYNRHQTVLLADLVQSHLPQGETVGILGLTYKPFTPVIEESAGLLLALELIERGVKVLAFDPAHPIGLPESIRLSRGTFECIADSKVVIVATAWTEFSRLRLSDFTRDYRDRTLIDAWGLYSDQVVPSELQYIRLGVGRHVSSASVATTSVATTTTNKATA